MEGIRDTLVVARAEAFRTLRSARAIVLFGLFALFTALGLLIAGGLQDETIQQLAEAGAAERSQLLMQRTALLGTFYEFDPALMEAFQAIPIAILLIFKAALFFLPAYIALLGFDQVSAELGSRSIRYLAVRTARSSIVFGKFLAQAAVLAALLFAVNLAMFVYARFSNEWFGWGAMVVLLFKFWLAALVFSLSWVALTTLCSTLFRAPALGLVTNFFLLFVLLIVNAVSAFGTDRQLTATGMPSAPEITSWVGYVGYGSPWYYATNLLHPDPGPLAVSGGALMGFTAVFLVAAYAVLRARDV